MSHEHLRLICRALLAGTGETPSPAEIDALAEYVRSELGVLPDYLRLPFRLMAALFFFHFWLSRGRRFRNAEDRERLGHLERWRARGWVFGDFVRLIESLVVFRAVEMAGDR